VNVLMSVPEMGAGGAEDVVSTLARGILSVGGQVSVASSGGWRAAALEQAGARLVPVPLRGRRPADLARAALATRRDTSVAPVDLMHAHNVKAAAVTALAARRMPRVPLVVTLHGVADSRYRTAARILRRCADQLAAVSADVAERVTAAGFPASRVRVIENAVAMPARHRRDDARTRLGLAPDTPVVLCIARMAPQKRHDLLVAAWRMMPPDAVLIIAGDGSTRPAVEAAVHHSGLQQRIRLLGERRDIDWLLAAADVCVLPTDWEGLPISVLESMAAGVPVVASAVGGLVRLAPDALHLVAPRSAAALATGLQRVLRDEDLRRSMVAVGAELMAGRFSPQRMWSQYDELYSRLGAGHRPAALRTAPGGAGK
jgi:glycosyltransferase involved in cell wall biosynthesis